MAGAQRPGECAAVVTTARSSVFPPDGSFGAKDGEADRKAGLCLGKINLKERFFLTRKSYVKY